MAHLRRRSRNVNGRTFKGNFELCWFDDFGNFKTGSLETKLKGIANSLFAKFEESGKVELPSGKILYKNSKHDRGLTLFTLADRVLEYVKIYRPRSYRAYSYALSLFKEFTGDIKISSISVSHIAKYVEFRLGSGVKMTSVNMEVRQVKAGFNKAVLLDLIPDSPVQKAEQLKIPKKRSRKTFSNVELDLIFSNIQNIACYRFCFVARYTGMRLNEIANIQFKDIEQDFIQVRNKPDFQIKDDEERSVPIPSKLRAYLDVLLGKKDNVMLLNDPDTYLIRKSNGNKYLGDSVSRKFRDVLHRLGIYDRHFHHLRNTYATNFLRAGGDIEMLRDILGHSTLTTTAIYLESDNEAKLKAVRDL